MVTSDGTNSGISTEGNLEQPFTYSIQSREILVISWLVSMVEVG